MPAPTTSAEHPPLDVSIADALVRVGMLAPKLRDDAATVIAVCLADDLDKAESARPSPTTATIELIQRAVTERYGLHMRDMTTRDRHERVAHPRQVAMFLAYEITKASLQEIGAAFGGRDHGTVIHACKAVKNRMATDVGFFAEVKALRQLFTVT
jgi:chromosomal replication initiator protein